MNQRKATVEVFAGRSRRTFHDAFAAERKGLAELISGVEEGFGELEAGESC